MMSADSTFFDIFSYDLAAGNKADWHLSWDRCMVSEEFANAHFGDKDPIGQVIFSENGGSQLTVSGVLKDFGNSVLKTPDVLVRGEMMPSPTLWPIRAFPIGVVAASLPLEKSASVSPTMCLSTATAITDEFSITRFR